MPLILAPSFDDHTREQVEAHLERVRIRRIAAVVEYQQGRLNKLGNEANTLEGKLNRTYNQLEKAIMRLDDEIAKIEVYLNNCQNLKNELGLVNARIELAKG